MRLLADENVAGSVIRALREAGQDVLSIATTNPGASDDAVLAQAREEGRIFLTHDKDFGELAFRVGAGTSCGVILLRLGGAGSEEDQRRAVAALLGRDDWAGRFSVIEKDRVRMRSPG